MTVNGINFGMPIIRDFLRLNVPQLELKTPDFAQHLWSLARRIVCLLDYFQQHSVKAVVLCDGVGHESFLRNVAVANGVPTYVIHYTDPIGRCFGSFEYPSGERFAHYKNFFRQLSAREQEVGIEWAKRSLDARFKGDKKEIQYMKTSIYEVAPGEKVLEQNDKLKVIICPHTLYDDLYPCGWQVFGGFVEWIDHLGQLSERTDYDWYLKIHPADLGRDEEFIKGYLKRYPRIKLVPKWTSPKQLKAEGIKFAFTIYGTLGHEYPALGIQVINAGNNPHIAFDFCYNPKTPEEFDSIVFNLPNLVDRRVDMQEIYQFYCIHYLYYNAPSDIRGVFFKNVDLHSNSWIGSEQRYIPISEEVKRYKYHLDDWTPEFHEITKRKTEELFHEMDNRRDDVFYKNPPEIIRKKLEAVGLSLD